MYLGATKLTSYTHTNQHLKNSMLLIQAKKHNEAKKVTDIT